MPSAWAINEDAGSPEYAAQELRRIAAHWLLPGVSDRFGARQGVRPHSGAVVTVSGTTWTVHDCLAVVYPGATSVSGPYVVQQPATSDSLNPADGSNPRIDALDLQVRDDDEDASGERDVRVVYVPGTPAGSPSAPSLTANSLRLATILVPAGGSPSPSVQTLAPYTVASGGTLPVRNDSELPSAGNRYAGMVVYHQEADELRTWNGSSWLPAGRGQLVDDDNTGAVEATSVAYTALSGGPQVVVHVPASGRVAVDITAEIDASTVGAMSFTFSGANTLAGSDNRGITGRANFMTHHRRVVRSGLNPGLTTVTCVYRDLSDGSGVNFRRRQLIVETLP